MKFDGMKTMDWRAWLMFVNTNSNPRTSKINSVTFLAFLNNWQITLQLIWIGSIIFFYFFFHFEGTGISAYANVFFIWL